MRKILLFVLAAITNTTLFAQETLKDIVPVLKGTKYGLQYHSGKEFYPAVFDKIHWDHEAENRTFYFTDGKDDVYFKVEKQGKLYKLYGNKKMVLIGATTASRFSPPRILADERLIEDQDIGGYNDPYRYVSRTFKEGVTLIDSFKTDFDDTAVITVWYDAGQRLFRFKYKDDWLENFDCDKVIRLEGEPAYSVYYSKAIIRKDSKQGMVDFKSRKLLLPFLYDSIRSVHSEAFIVKKDGKQGVVNALNEFIVPTAYQSISTKGSMLDGYCFLYGQNEAGFDIIGIEIYKPTRHNTKIIASGYDDMPRHFFAYATFPEKHIYFIISKNRKLGVIDRDGKEILPAEYDDIIKSAQESSYAEPLRFLWLSQDKLYGWMDMATQTLVNPVYSNRVFSPFGLEKEIENFPVIVFLVRRGKGPIFFADCFGKEFIRDKK